MNDKKLKVVRCKIADLLFLNGKDDLCLKQSTKGHNFCNLYTRMHNFQHFFLKENILQAQIFKKQELKTYDGSLASSKTT